MHVDTEADKQYLKNLYTTLVTEELLRMHAEGTLTELAYSVLEDELLSRGVSVPSRPEDSGVIEQTHPVFRSTIVFIQEHWRGNRKLSSAFWRVGVAGTVLVWFLLLAAAIAGNLLQTLTGPPSKSVFYITYFSVLGIWQIFAWVSIWRCAPNTKTIVWTYIARILVIVTVLFFTMSILQIPLVLRE